MDVEITPSANERIIPIKILDSCHGKSSNQITSNPTPSSQIGAKPKRQSLLVTYDDGTTSETQGTVTNLNNNININNNNSINVSTDNNVMIQEIGIDTLEREMAKTRAAETNSKNIISPDASIGVTSKMKGSLSQPRHVPIRLDDGKIVQRDPDETMQIRSEFTNYSHEEILNRNDNVSNNSQKDSTSKKDSVKMESAPQNERIIPIKLDSGEEIMPIFTKLEDPEPPTWSTFSKKSQQNGKSSPVKEKIVPMKVETDRESHDDRGRKKSKPTIEKVGVSSNPPDSTDDVHRSSRSTDRKQHTVRFNVNEEKRSESRESFTRKSSSSNRSYGRGKPPSGSSERHSYASGDGSRRSNYPSQGSHRSGSPGFRREQTPDNDQKTLMDIDRDINRIWKELQELDATKPSKSPLTPVKVRSYTIPTASQPERVSRPTIPPPSIPLSSSLPTSNLTQRTIWDSDVPSYSATFLPSHEKVEPIKPEMADPEPKRSFSGSRASPLRSTIGGYSEFQKSSVRPQNQGDFIVAPLASAETTGSPNSPPKVAIENNNDKKLSTADFDDGIYEGVEFRAFPDGPRASKREKSESPSKKSRKSSSPREHPTISDEIQIDGNRSDAATQTWQNDEDKKVKKTGSCNIL